MSEFVSKGVFGGDVVKVSQLKETTKDYYLGAVKREIERLKEYEKPGKTVICRVIKGKTDLSPFEISERLFKAYPELHPFCFTDEKEQYWIGASPELLLSYTDGKLHTMALAGTRPAGSEGEWSQKDIEEQQIVVDYIVDVFERHGLVPHLSERHTRKAGPVEHLCTEITCSCRPMETERLEALLADLAPTPALCGYPKETAMRHISLSEENPRMLYGGYFGVNFRGEFEYFVNLRSMVMDAATGEYAIYTGSGITAKSDPEQEWEETARKGSTLLNILNEQL